MKIKQNNNNELEEKNMDFVDTNYIVCSFLFNLVTLTTNNSEFYIWKLQLLFCSVVLCLENLLQLNSCRVASGLH